MRPIFSFFASAVAVIVLAAPTLGIAQNLDNNLVLRTNQIDFDGSAHLNQGDVDFVDGATALTFLAWIKPSALPTPAQTIVTKANTCPTQEGGLGGVGMSVLGSGAIAAGINDASGNRLDGQSAANVIPLDMWTHVAMVFDGSQALIEDKLKLYVDGRLQSLSFTSTVPFTSIPATAHDLRVGVTPDSLCNPNAFVGRIFEVDVIDRALSRGRVRLLKDTKRPPGA